MPRFALVLASLAAACGGPPPVLEPPPSNQAPAEVAPDASGDAAPAAPARGALTGTIEVDPALAAHATSGVVFVALRPLDPASGQPTGMVSAAAKLDRLPPLDVAIDQEHVLLASAPPLTGPHEVRVILDHDGDVVTREPTDLELRTRVDLPAHGVRLVLDRLRPP